VEVNTIFDPTGTRILGYANGEARSIGLLTRPDNNYIRYHALDFIFEGRPSPSWDLYAAYTLSFRYGPGIDELGQVTGLTQNFNPRQTEFFSGYAPGDMRHQFKLHGFWTKAGFGLGANIAYLTGTPRFKLYNVADAGVGPILRAPIGTQPGTPNDGTTISEFRVPDVLTVDVRAQYDFQRLIGHHLYAILDVFNVLNLTAATDVQSVDGPNFGRVTARQMPFQLRLGIRYVQ
jgi:hypothetical protein